MKELKDYILSLYTISGDRLKLKSTSRVTNMDTVIMALTTKFEDSSRKAASDAILSVIEDHQSQIRLRVSSFTGYNTPEDFLDFVFKKNGFKCDETGDEFTIVDGELEDTIPTDRATVETIIIKEMYEYNHSIPRGEDGRATARSYIKDELIVQLDFYIRTMKIRNVVEMREHLKYNPKIDIDKLLGKTLKMMKATGDMEVNITIFKHFLWSIKRHIYGRDTKLELWVAIYGGQNIGKNHFVEKVLAPPLRGHHIDTELSSIADMGREIGKFQNRFLINFDELAKGGGQNEDSSDKLSSAAIAGLKSILTRKKLTIRQMGSQNQMVITKNFTCMSTANIHVYDVIDDPTGMRRFFEIKLNHPNNVWFDKKTMDVLKKYCDHFYTGIDENNDEGYLIPNTPVFDKVKVIQASYKAKSSIDYWLDDGEYDVSDKARNDDVIITITELYEDYKSHCKQAGYHAFNRSNFKLNMDRRFDIKKHGNRQILRALLRDN